MRLRPALLALGLGLALVLAALHLLERGVEPGASAPAAGPEDAGHEPGRAAEADLVVPGEALAGEEPEALPISGRVVEGETWRAVPDLPVLLRGRSRLEEARTDAEGRFTFPAREDRGDATLACVLEPGWVQVGGPRRLALGEARGRDEVEVVLERAPALRWSGVALDARTGEPVPALRIHARSSLGFEEVETGHDGRFASRGAWPAATWRVDAVDDDGERSFGVGRFELAGPTSPDAAPWRLEVAIGPTYFLEPAHASGGAWHARLAERREDPGVSGRLRVDGAGRLALNRGAPLVDGDFDPPAPRLAGVGTVTIAEDGRPYLVEPTRFWPRVRVRGPLAGPGPHGAFAWVRFPRVEYEPTAGLTPWLELRGEDLVGRARVPGTVGVQGGPHALERRPRAVVRGRVSTPEGTEVPGARVWLVPDRGGSWPRGSADGQRARFRGLVDFSFDLVWPGTYRLVAIAPGFPVAAREVRVVPGENRLEELVLARDPRDLVVEGSLACAEASSGLALTAFLRPLATAPFGTWSARPVDLAATGREPQLRFDGVAAARYELFLVPERGGLFPPRVETVDPPWHDRAIPCEVEGEAPWRALRAVDAAGRAVDELDLLLDLGRGVLPVEPDLLPSAPIAWSPRIEGWRLWARGFRPHRGTQADFHGGREAEVVLRPGWGVALHFREGTGPARAGAVPDDLEVFARSPVVDVRVTAAGGLEAVADADGSLVLDALTAPPALVVHREGWKVVAVQHLGSGGAEDRRPARHGEYVVWMASDAPEEGWGGPVPDGE